MRIGVTEVPEKSYKLIPLANNEAKIELYAAAEESYDADGNKHVTANVLTLHRKNYDGLADSIEANFSWYWQQAEREQTEQLTAQFTKAVQKWMDSKAQERGYDNIISACTYAGSTDEKFAAEGKAAKEWRDKVWRYCYDVVAQVVSGGRDVPTISELLAELPRLVW